jgi:zinc protease
MFNKIALSDHPYLRAEKNITEDLAGLRRADLAAAASRIFTHAGLRLSIVGDVTDDVAARTLDVVFGGLPEGKAVPPIPRATVPQVPKIEVAAFNSSQTLLTFGTAGYYENDPDYMASAVAVSMIEATINGIVRQQRGLSYEVSYEMMHRDGSSLAIGQLRTANETAVKSLAAVKEALLLARLGVDQNYVDVTVRYLKGIYSLKFETNPQVASLLTQLQLGGYSKDFLSQRDALLDSVTLEDVQRVMSRLTDTGSLMVVAVGQPEGLTAQ